MNTEAFSFQLFTWSLLRCHHQKDPRKSCLVSASKPAPDAAVGTYAETSAVQLFLAMPIVPTTPTLNGDRNLDLYVCQKSRVADCDASQLTFRFVQEVTIKRITADRVTLDREAKQVYREINLLKQMDHENVAKLLDVFTSPRGDLYIVIENEVCRH